MRFGHQESRKFIDLLLQVTNNKWANIDANKEIKVGDFGRIDRATGELIVEGNLYQHPKTRSVMEDYPIEITATTDFERYLSKGVRELGLSPSVNAGLQPFADLGFEGKWEFSRNRGALLILIAPRISTMQGFPTETVVEKRFKRILKDRVFCTDVVSCPAFCLYLGNKTEHVFELSFKADVPIPAAPGVTAGGGIGTNWKFSNASGLLKKGRDDRGEYVYHPLYTLKSVKWGKVEPLLRLAEPALLEDAARPWSELDDEGEEQIPDSEKSIVSKFQQMLRELVCIGNARVAK
ncbi:hypothetical protein J3R30DRAFT_120841 [Lentinula aciculospora]|uniref:Uncharacterized protein n=1 Tax=Lentinula aciculospora TaxID=153920 RepID=A0A9W9DY20_9AGAR|nr:hypothetical protein J3R30DRAFT_120841 [Lentinula aciculospora]